MNPFQTQVAEALGVRAKFDVAEEIERRTEFLASYLATSGLRCFVLGISGGVDSTTAGRMAQMAVERLRMKGQAAHFIAMRLPYGVQLDEDEAQLALSFIRPDRTLVVDIKSACDATLESLVGSGATFTDANQQDFVMGNIKARQRMVVQYAVAGAHRGLVIGTDHAAEAVMGFFTKHGDGACDLAPLSGLTKRRVRALAMRLGIPVALVNKVPSADLESLLPQKPDEAALGIAYELIDDYLELRPIAPSSAEIIEAAYRNTAHKRADPAKP